MGRKTNEQKIDEKLSDILTVEQLIKILQGIPQDAPVGVIGHFGEFHGFNKHQFRYSENRHCYITPNDNWRQEHRRDINVVEVSQIDIGPDPD